jgi:hypothetical protein
MQSRSIISQLHIAVRNPTALLLGGACGALVPLGTCYVTHELLHGDLVQLSILLLLVLGGLVFSCLSVYAFAQAVFGTWYKALGFVIALEGRAKLRPRTSPAGATWSTLRARLLSGAHPVSATWPSLRAKLRPRTSPVGATWSRLRARLLSRAHPACATWPGLRAKLHPRTSPVGATWFQVAGEAASTHVAGRCEPDNSWGS